MKRQKKSRLSFLLSVAIRKMTLLCYDTKLVFFVPKGKGVPKNEWEKNQTTFHNQAVIFKKNSCNLNWLFLP